MTDPEMLNMAVIIEKNAKTESSKYGDYRYYMIRTQKRSYDVRLNALRMEYPDLVVRRVNYYGPNSILLFNWAKERLAYLKSKGNHFEVDDLDRFFRDIEQICPSLEISSRAKKNMEGGE
ncbi:hypothetical protein RF55_23633 [Lasius niger]|uniref:DUF3627 domain-containing protein n=1 Tax=Lasius niger TaxID=67767 RepID=A0A0J7JVV1_LASNI|nr:hypothetical protein RF55_23633 [Lasius niger]